MLVCHVLFAHYYLHIDTCRCYQVVKVKAYFQTPTDIDTDWLDSDSFVN